MSVIDTSIQKYPEKCTECPWCGYVRGSNVHIECKRCVSIEWFTVEKMNEIGKLDGCPLRSVDSVIEQMEALKIGNGYEWGPYSDGKKAGIDACIAILRGLKDDA